MKQKGFATIFGLCLILVVALTVKGIQEAEANHAREVFNFELEQALQSAAESGIIEAAELVRGQTFSKGTIFTTTKTFKNGEQTINITVEVKGERGKIYLCPVERTSEIVREDIDLLGAGVYLMSRATIEDSIFGEDIYRRAYAYVLDAADTKIIFMELPTRYENYVIKND
ncbi:MAG: hypothetical protein IJL14_07410 [Selenomonadaceae bacterium]|nr:hypothetical protein [Selenomonadaceae bacterium]